MAMSHDQQIQQLNALASQLKSSLSNAGLKLVTAESCTCGLVASSLGSVPGISTVYCGSSVTYREETKANWLDVSRDDLNNPEITAVSETVAIQMAEGVLRATPEADIAVSITGHLGPNAPPNLDGLVFIAIALRGQETSVQRHTLADHTLGDLSVRETRRLTAAYLVLSLALSKLS